MYSQLAHLYDWPGSLAFAEAALEQTRTVFEANDIQPGATILDVGCGTGTLAIELAQLGYVIFGLDLSEPMLFEGRRKAKEAQVPVEFLHADMREFNLNPPVDVAICYYDSLNHLVNEAELECTFRCIADSLKPQGLFLFDVNTLETYHELWQGRDVYEGPNYRMTIQSAFDQFTETGTAHFSAMEHTEDGLECKEEVVHEKYFADALIQQLLEKAGFTDIRREDFSPLENPDFDFPLKRFWQCRKA